METSTTEEHTSAAYYSNTILLSFSPTPPEIEKTLYIVVVVVVAAAVVAVVAAVAVVAVAAVVAVVAAVASCSAAKVKMDLFTFR